MKNYFTISEFARLRSIDINSLRYYEKLGILIPVYIDPNTKYRYYSAEQLAELDVILLCINLGIPLKQLKNYIDESGTFHSRALVEEGKRLTEEKIRELQTGLHGIEHTLTYLEDTERFSNRHGTYLRHFLHRCLIAEEISGELCDVKVVENAFANLHSYAREKKLHPVMPMGILLKYFKHSVQKYACWELAEKDAENEKIIVLPEADYQCVQKEWRIAVDVQELVENTFDIQQDTTVFVSNMAQSRFRFGTKVGELQLLMSEKTSNSD